MPGDVPKSVKIAMLEGTHPDKRRSKAFRKGIKARERAAERERARQEIRAGVT